MWSVRQLLLQLNIHHVTLASALALSPFFERFLSSPFLLTLWHVNMTDLGSSNHCRSYLRARRTWVLFGITVRKRLLLVLLWTCRGSLHSRASNILRISPIHLGSTGIEHCNGGFHKLFYRDCGRYLPCSRAVRRNLKPSLP